MLGYQGTARDRLGGVNALERHSFVVQAGMVVNTAMSARPTTGLLIGTSEGLFSPAVGDRHSDPSFGKREVSALAVREGAAWAVAGRNAIVRRDPDGTWTDAARSELEIVCLADTSAGVLAGTEEAHLLRLVGDDGVLAPVEAFETVVGRETWFTPWGGPPAVRSIAQDLAGRLHANVHVGGIPRSVDAGASWEPTIDIDADVHQVVAHPTEPDVVLAAGAVGLAVSVDGGSSWRIEREGLHATYARAVAVAGDRVLLSVSNGPRGGRAAVYRTALEPGSTFERCTDGLPEWFDGNIDSGRLDARGSEVAFGTGDGEVFVSDDAGERWTRAATGLPSIRAVRLV